MLVRFELELATPVASSVEFRPVWIYEEYTAFVTGGIHLVPHRAMTAETMEQATKGMMMMTSLK